MKNFLLYTLFTLSNILIFLMIIIHNIRNIFRVFLFLTILSFTLSTVYFTIIWYFEMLLFLSRNNTTRLEELRVNKFYIHMKERIFKFAFTMSMTVCLGYWILCLGGEMIMVYHNNIINYYVHLLIGMQMIVEIILIEKNFKHEKHFVRDLIIILGANIIYCIVLTYVSRNYDIVIYPFMKLAIKNIIAVFIGIMSLSMNMYVIHYFIVDFKNKNYKKSNCGTDYDQFGQRGKNDIIVI